MKLSVTQKQKLLEEMKSNFWEQKTEEIGKVICIIAVALVFVGLTIFTGVTIDTLYPDFYCHNTIVTDNTPSFVANCADPNYTLTMWSFLSLGTMFWMFIGICALVIYLICRIIKHWIDSNIEKAFSRSINNLNKNKK